MDAGSELPKASAKTPPFRSLKHALVIALSEPPPSEGPPINSSARCARTPSEPTPGEKVVRH
eukprot:15457185-Alexandrium_andersonii.AAC.1